MEGVLSQANEGYERSGELKRRGYALKRTVRRVADICGIEEGEIFSKGRQQWRGKARSLLCFWVGREGRYVSQIGSDTIGDERSRNGVCGLWGRGYLPVNISSIAVLVELEVPLPITRLTPKER